MIWEQQLLLVGEGAREARLSVVANVHLFQESLSRNKDHIKWSTRGAEKLITYQSDLADYFTRETLRS